MITSLFAKVCVRTRTDKPKIIDAIIAKGLSSRRKDERIFAYTSVQVVV